MSKYCPEWIFGIFSAQTSREFLSSNNSIAGISRKYASAISERYNEVKFEEILDVAEKILQFLSEINAGEEARLLKLGGGLRWSYEPTALSGDQPTLWVWLENHLQVRWSECRDLLFQQFIMAYKSSKIFNIAQNDQQKKTKIHRS